MSRWLLVLHLSMPLTTGGPVTTPWRTVLGFGDEHITFAEVHERYRHMTADFMEIDKLHELGDALEQARIELGKDKSKPDLKSKEP